MSLQSMIFKFMCTKSDRKRDKNLRIPENITVIRDIAYDSRGQLLDLNLPAEPVSGNPGKKLPVIISIHGGGYIYGNKEVYKFYAANLAENGFAVINFNYRLAPKYKFPAPLEDTNNVCKWLTENAGRYSLDTGNVFIVGDSAGATLCSQYASIVTNPEYARLFDFEVPAGLTVRGTALNCGSYEFDLSNKAVLDYLGKRISKDDLRLDIKGSITPSFPPSFIMSAANDFLVSDVEPLKKLLEEKGIRTIAKIYGTKEQEYMGHVFHCNLNLAEAKECNKEQCDFFRTCMQNDVN